VCTPVGEELEAEATETVAIELKDHEFAPAMIEVPAGTITFEVTNNGSENHELAFLPGGGEVPVVDGAPDEEALEAAGAFELEAFPPGETCNATYALEPGTYTLFCIVESDDGQTHLDKGMKGQLTVT
jgi:plastocyanin